MKNFNLDETDIKEINSLFKITTNINRIYHKILTLEIENKKNTLEYKKNLEYLNIFIESEEKIYNNRSLTLDKLISWTKFIFKQKKQTSLDIIESIMKQNYDNIIYSRIINNLVLKIIQKYNTLNKLSNKELTNIMIILGMNKTKKLSNNDISKRIIIKNYIENDIYYTFLSLLQEQIENPSLKKLKQKLILAKYNTIFINKEIESYLLKNNFTIKTERYISSNIISDLLQESELNKLSKNILGTTIVNEEIYELLEITDMDYNSLTKVATSILRQCMINASLIFISDDIIEEIQNIINEYINNEEFGLIYPNNTISHTLINNCFKNIKTNKEKLLILSLK